MCLFTKIVIVVVTHLSGARLLSKCCNKNAAKWNGINVHCGHSELGSFNLLKNHIDINS